MRTLITVAVVCGVALYGMVAPVISLLGYTWFILMRPDFFSWSQGKFPYSVVLEVSVWISTIRQLGNLSVLFKSSITRWLILYHIPLGISTMFAVVPALSSALYGEFVRATIIALLLPVIIQTEQHLRWLLITIAASIGMVGVKFGLWGILQGGATFWDGYAGLDNNALALLLAMGVPFCWFARSFVKPYWAKLTFLAMVFFCITATIMTNGRGGILAMGTGLLLLILRSKHKVASLAVVAVLAMVPVMINMNVLVKRMATLEVPTADTSIQARLTHINIALRMSKDYPWHGVGFGNLNYIAMERRYVSSGVVADQDLGLKVHNGYLQVLVDSGIFALLIFLILLFGTIIRLQGSIRRCRKHARRLIGYPAAMQTALISYAQYSLGGGRESWGFYYMVLTMAAAWLIMERSLIESAAGTPVEASIPSRIMIPLRPSAVARAT